MSQGLISTRTHTTFPNTITKHTASFTPTRNFSLALTRTRYTKLRLSLKPQTRNRSCCCPIRAAAATTASGVYVNQESFYDLLGIPQSGSLTEIKQAYKQLARKYHPDVSPPDRTEEYTKRFIQVQEAYETLSDPNSRALYDRNLAAGLHLAFNARKQFNSNEGFNEKSEWRYRWMSQLDGLKRRRGGMDHDPRGNMSWAARMRMRRQRSQSDNECECECVS